MASATNYVFSTTKLYRPTKLISSSIPFSYSSSNFFTNSRNNQKLYPLIKFSVSNIKQDEQTGSKLEGADKEFVVKTESEEIDNGFVNKAINASIVLGFGTLAVTRLLTIDHEYWHGWTLYEILRYAPEHNWIAYEEALKENPVLAKMAISGIVYSLGDWIAQCYEGKPLFEFDRTRLFRSGLVGFTLHGSLSHYYYQLCEALIPSKDWWVVPAKIVFDQTVWSAVWNSIYFVVLGLLRFESPENILNELKTTFVPLLTAGWKLWPFTHLLTAATDNGKGYEVDFFAFLKTSLGGLCGARLGDSTILSTYSNEKSEARILDTTSEADPSSSSKKQ